MSKEEGVREGRRGKEIERGGRNEQESTRHLIMNHNSYLPITCSIAVGAETLRPVS